MNKIFKAKVISKIAMTKKISPEMWKCVQPLMFNVTYEEYCKWHDKLASNKECKNER